jgi:hypothetical protein
VIEVTDEMLDAFGDAGGYDIGGVGDGLAAVLAIVELDLRAAVAADIEAALAADQADSDVSSGEAIWEQGGYRNGLSAAADIARGEP